jgi:hypothetical protein
LVIGNGKAVIGNERAVRGDERFPALNS